MPAGFKRVAILGTGLIGGSFGLALRKLRPRPRVVGWDKPDVLRRARERSVIDRGDSADLLDELRRALLGDLVPPEPVPLALAAVSPCGGAGPGGASGTRRTG